MVVARQLTPTRYAHLEFVESDAKTKSSNVRFRATICDVSGPNADLAPTRSEGA